MKLFSLIFLAMLCGVLNAQSKGEAKHFNLSLQNSTGKLLVVHDTSLLSKQIIDTVDVVVLAVDWDKLEKGLIFRKAVRKGHTEMLYRYDSTPSNTGLIFGGGYTIVPTTIWDEIKYYQVVFGEWEDQTKYVIQSWFKDKQK